MLRFIRFGLLVIFGVTGGGCSKTEFDLHPTPDIVIGTYEFNPFGHEKLKISEDKTFRIELTNDLLELRVSKGTWRIDENELIELTFDSDGHTTLYRYAKVEGKFDLVWEERYREFLESGTSDNNLLIFGEKSAVSSERTNFNQNMSVH